MTLGYNCTMNRVVSPIFTRNHGWSTRCTRTRASRTHSLSPTHAGSLTEVLRQQCRDFQVRILFEGIQHASIDECRKLGLSHPARVWTRNVLLCDGQQPRIYAHSILPLTRTTHTRLWLRTLGTRPLGDVLFTQPGLPRSPLHYQRLSCHHRLVKSIRHWPLHFPLLARRSVFLIQHTPLLVTEVFLDGHILPVSIF
ncbi:MAG: chorismate lyase [Betaproteobacteria bacterium]|jgi:4-hydroxybenzoate synthetase (chorismate lyase)|nr:chorismate lyase [Betaproteobacteria bacterium]